MRKLVFTGVLAIILLGLGGCASTSSSQAQASGPSVDTARAARINVQLGVEYFKQGELEQALKKLERAIGQDPNLPSAHNALALLKQRLGQIEEAEKHFQRAIKLDPSYSEAQNNYGVFLYSQGRYREAETHFLEAVKNPLYGTPELAYENAGRAAQKQSELNKAEKYYRKALQIQPRLPKSSCRMAEINFNKGHLQKAQKYLQDCPEVVVVPSALASASIKQFCAAEWPSDYRMQEHCVERQHSSARRIKEYMDRYNIKEGSSGPYARILAKCLDEWKTSKGTNYRMVDHCVERQVQSYKNLQLRESMERQR
ncbi:type IV pilus biogenesis/stability protein PilW [Nitrosococcus wardiae]|uniref:type IV pilus biogenesis/stability protein PilW n=1 Tax=Nitrosococcus wardiae TaxID=1814290 RepID=UPI001F0ED4EC|nr:type IV pilus biogenesis/stability protein PilW [Nitrosococcus wardiae]